jgi:peptidoglycan-associated lipoprotein
MKNRKSLLFAMIVFVCMAALWGCPKKAEVTATPEGQQEEADRAAAERARAEQQRLAEEQAKQDEAAEARERAAAAATGLQPVYFDFDQSFIRNEAREVMKANADWLKANPRVKIRIEGNADERGTVEYNQALGQRRAASAKKYLTDLGISGSRISLISYGKEKPVCNEHSEDCWQKNRRADLIAD